MRPRTKILLIAIIFLFVIQLWYNSKDSNNKESISQEGREIRKHTIAEAYSNSKRFVKMKLVSPSTADFPWKYSEKSHQINDSTFQMYGYVDAQNAFGAVIRNNWMCKVVFKADNSVICDGILLY